MKKIKPRMLDRVFMISLSLAYISGLVALGATCLYISSRIGHPPSQTSSTPSITLVISYISLIVSALITAITCVIAKIFPQSTSLS